MSTDRWGIDDRYYDVLGKEHVTSSEGRAAILRAMGLDPEAPRRDGQARDVRVVTPGHPLAVDQPSLLTLEDGTTMQVAWEIPAKLPLGYHTLRPLEDEAGARETLLIASPGRCFLPADLRTWGWAAQLYAARSRASWGIGDLADLRHLSRWSRDALGAGVIMVNPLCAATLVPPIEPSPYYPSSRRFRNPLFLRIEEVPGADTLGGDLERLAAAGRALNGERKIDRNAIFRLKMEALERIFDRFGGDERFDRYLVEQDEALTQFAVYCVLAEAHGRDWRRWPEEYRRADPAVVGRVAAGQARRVRFHSWLQWLIDMQLAAASADIAIIHDLPIGLDIAGADAWCWQDLMASGVSVGAPPDEFNENGQDWGLTPFIPHKLRAAGYSPIIQTIRAMLRHAGGLRIDHVMGLFRLFWIPSALGAKGGSYVRMHSDELLAIVALESHRARAFVIGEDLGTVEEGVRERMAEAHMLSYRLLVFEPNPPPQFPELALSSVTTHDLPTIAGLWTGADLRNLRKIGQQPNESGIENLKRKLAKDGRIGFDSPVEEAVVAIHRALAEAPSRILLATLDDALAVEERPNMPGTTDVWPNWSLPLPKTLEEIEDMTLPRQVATALSRR